MAGVNGTVSDTVSEKGSREKTITLRHSDHTKLTTKVEELKNLKRFMKKDSHRATPWSRALASAAITTAPAIPPETAATFGQLLISSFFAASPLQHDFIDIPGSAPGATFLRDSVIDGAVDDLIRLNLILEDVFHIHLACDKAPSGNFAKCISWFDKEQKKVVTYTLDIDPVEGNSQAAAEGIFNAMRKLPALNMYTNNRWLLTGLTTDSGGGGVLESLAEFLRKFGLTVEVGFLVANCTLHALNLAFQNPVQLSFGASETGVSNAMQLVFACWSIQDYLPTDVHKRFFEFIVEKEQLQPASSYKYQELSKPVFGRWWYVGKAVKMVRRFWKVYKKMTESLIKEYDDTKNKINKAASDLQSMMNEPVLEADLAFIEVYVDMVFNKHFDWCQEKDTYTGQAGFRSREILVRFFIIRRDIDRFKEAYNNDNSPEFREFRELNNQLSENDQAIMSKKASEFITEAIKMVEKHFARWARGYLLFIGTFSSQQTATVVARVLLGHEPLYSSSPSEVFLPEHKERVDLHEFERFVRRWSKGSFNDVKEWTPFNAHKEALQLVADGADIWAHNGTDAWAFTVPDDSNVGLLRGCFLERFSPLASATQHCERGVKLSNFVTSTGRGPELGGCYAMSRNKFESAHDESKERKRQKDEAKSKVSEGAEAIDDNIAGQQPKDAISGKEEKKKKRVRDPRGCEKAENIAKRARQEFYAQEQVSQKMGAEKYQKERDRLYELLKPKEGMQQLRNDEMVRRLTISYGTPAVKGPNKKQQHQGVKYTPAALGRTAFKDLRSKPHTSELQKELVKRGILTEAEAQALKFKKLKQKLQEAEDDSESFKQQCDEADFSKYEPPAKKQSKRKDKGVTREPILPSR